MIAGSPRQVLRQQVYNSRPTLVAFVSGNPQPDIVWRFNGQNLPSGVLVNGNELLLPANIRPDVVGRYTCQASNSVGVDSAEIHVSLICKSVTDTYPSLFLARIHLSLFL